MRIASFSVAEDTIDRILVDSSSRLLFSYSNFSDPFLDFNNCHLNREKGQVGGMRQY